MIFLSRKPGKYRQRLHPMLYTIDRAEAHGSKGGDSVILKNAKVFGEDGTFRFGDISTEGELLSAAPSGEVLDCEGLLAIPGIIDIHTHGCNGLEFCDGGEAVAGMAAWLMHEGITSFMPASMTTTEERLFEICAAAGEYENHGDKNSSEMLGVYLEGPFISEAKRGAQDATYIRVPDSEFFDRLQEAAEGRIRIVTVAPEVPGAMDFLRATAPKAICSIAHSDANYDTALDAFRNGASHVTHLFNGMSAFHHRDPGIVGAAFDSGCRIELICDGNHVCPSVVRAAWKMFGDDRVIMISDGMRASGMPEGDYRLCGRTYSVRGTVARMEDGALAGPVISLSACMKKSVTEMGIPLAAAVKSVTVNPARELGLFDRIGSLAVGKQADIVLLDGGLNVKKVIKKGRVV